MKTFLLSLLLLSPRLALAETDRSSVRPDR
jgi:hypothetical protein